MEQLRYGRNCRTARPVDRTVDTVTLKFKEASRPRCSAKLWLPTYVSNYIGSDEEINVRTLYLDLHPMTAAS